jgi:hypothetical protein
MAPIVYQQTSEPTKLSNTTKQLVSSSVFFASESSRRLFFSHRNRDRRLFFSHRNRLVVCFFRTGIGIVVCFFCTGIGIVSSSVFFAPESESSRRLFFSHRNRLVVCFFRTGIGIVSSSVFFAPESESSSVFFAPESESSRRLFFFTPESSRRLFFSHRNRLRPLVSKNNKLTVTSSPEEVESRIIRVKSGFMGSFCCFAQVVDGWKDYRAGGSRSRGRDASVGARMWVIT